MKKLTNLQKRFADNILRMELVGKVNVREAYEAAGYASRGETARKEAEKTLRKPPVREYLRRARALRASRIKRTEDDIIAEYEKLAFSNNASFYNDDGTLKPLKELTEEQTAAIKSIEIDEQRYVNRKGKQGILRKVKITLHPKKASLDSLAKIRGMMKQDIMTTDSVNIFIDGEKVDGLTHKD